jgi:hypothetical protein
MKLNNNTKIPKQTKLKIIKMFSGINEHKLTIDESALSYNLSDIN